MGQGWSSGVWYIDFSYGSHPRFKMGHSATYSDKLVERLIRLYSRLGDTVLDPFLGSGTTMMVAKRMRRKCIAYEVNPEFMKMIRRKVGLSFRQKARQSSMDQISSLVGISEERVREKEKKEENKEGIQTQETPELKRSVPISHSKGIPNMENTTSGYFQVVE